MQRWRRSAAAILCALMLAGSLGGCDTSAPVFGQPDGPTIAVGVSRDLPGLGLLHDGDYSGFDVDVAQYVAKVLGYARKQIVFKSITPQTAQSMLDAGRVDMVVSSLPMDARQRRGLQYAGPYFVARQDLLIRRDSRAAITGVQSLADRIVCTARGSGADANIVAAVHGVTIQIRDTYSQCVTALLAGEADAVSADDAVISGLMKSKGRQYLSMVGRPFAQVPYAIRVHYGDPELSSKILAALRSMVRDGSWRQAVETMQNDIHYTMDPALNPPVMRSNTD